MRIRFVPEAGAAERGGVAAALARLGLASSEVDGDLVGDGVLAPDDAVEIAAMRGVASVATGASAARERALAWIGGAAATLGVLAIVAANVPAPLGSPPDMSRAVDAVRPPWPLLPWFAAVDLAPSWVPVRFVLVLAAAALFAWPTLGRRLAERRPWMHAALGGAALLVVAALAAWELSR